MKQAKIKNINKKEIKEIMRVENDVWEPSIRATEDKFSSRFKIFPEGIFGAYVKDVLVGVSTSQRIDSCILLSWDLVTDFGYIKRTNKPFGKYLYVVSLGVAKDYRGNGIGTLLLDAQKGLMKKLSLDSLFLGSRIPGYYKSNESIENYLEKDPEILFYIKNGFNMEQLKKDFMREDKKSKGYGIIMGYKNEDGYKI